MTMNNATFEEDRVDMLQHSMTLDCMAENDSLFAETTKPLHEACSTTPETSKSTVSRIIPDERTLSSQCSTFEGSYFDLNSTTEHDDDQRSIFSTRNGDEDTVNSFSRSSSFSDGNHKSGKDAINKRLQGYGIVELQKKECRIGKLPLQLKMTVDHVHRWLFVEGGHFDDVQGLMSNYCALVRDLNIPVDRLYYGGIGLHPKLTAYLWKWEPHDFIFREMPQEIFERRNELFSPDEPFCVMEQGRADFVRIKATDDYIPPDTAKWFRGENYLDYFALPDIHRDRFQGGLAWATKDPDGFSDEHLQFFESTLPALTTVLRLHTNDLVLTTLTEKMELEIEERTEELAQANQRLAEANEQLATQSKKQLEHFACMSHEIRTPLNCIVGLSSLLLESSDELLPDVAESIKMIATSADLLHAVVDDVLDYSKMESGAFEVDIRTTSLQDTMNSVVRAMQEKARAKDVQIITQYGSTVPENVDTDPRRIQQVLYNLLGNACKFSKQGGVVELSVSLATNAHGNDSDQILRFSVKDYGKGIAESDFEAIFQPFNQASKETQTIYGGTGLGLAITLKLVERLGGNISVDSKLGDYAEFVIELPYAGDRLDVQKLSSSLQNTTIVLVEEGESTANHPFRPDVIEEYKLDFVRVSSWEVANKVFVDTPSRFWTDQQYVVIAPSTRSSRSSYKKFARSAGHFSLITFGPSKGGTMADMNGTKCHWTSLTGVFPTVALQAIASLVRCGRQAGDHLNRSMPCTLFDLDATWTLSDERPPPMDEISVPSAPSSSSCLGNSMTCTSGIAGVEKSDNNFSMDIHLDDGEELKTDTSTSGEVVLPYIDDYTRELRAPSAQRQKNTSTPSLFQVLRVDSNHNSMTLSSSISSLDSLSPQELSSTQRPLFSSGLEKSASALSSCSAPAKVYGAPTQAIRPPRKLRVLYAEDNKVNQKVLGRILKKLGVVDLDIVDNGKLAVDACAIKKYDLIFMDIQMPVMDGLEATKILKSTQGTPSGQAATTKIIFCTAHALDDFRHQAEGVGCDGFISKPFNLTTIETLLDDCEPKYTHQEENASIPNNVQKPSMESNHNSISSLASLSPQELLSSQKPSFSSGLDKSSSAVSACSAWAQVSCASSSQTMRPPRKLKVLYAEDNKVNQKVLGRILKKLGVVDLDIVDNGKLAVDACAVKNYDIIFMDIQMPVMDGLEATKILKSTQEETPSGQAVTAKIIFCTAHALEDFRSQAVAAGGDGFISKPFNLKTIETLLDECEPSH